MIRVFGYLAWRSTANRISRQLRHLRSPRYAAALLLGLAYLWFMIVGQRPASAAGAGAATAPAFTFARSRTAPSGWPRWPSGTV